MKNRATRTEIAVMKYFAQAAYEAGAASRQPEIEQLRAALTRVTGDPWGFTLGVQHLTPKSEK